MSNIKKLMMSAAGGGGLNVEEVFSTYLYKGTGSLGYDKAITNGIALGDFGVGSSTKFGGETGDYLGRTTEFTGNSDSNTFTFSGWIYRENSDSNMYLYSADNGTYHFNINVNSSNNMIVSGWRNTSSRSLYTQSSGLNVPWGWVHILISIDLSSTANRHIYINDVDQSSKFNWSTYSNDPIKFTWGKHSIGAFPLNGGEVDGNLAHIYLDYTYRNLSTTSNRRIFIDANGGSTSPSSLAALNPIMYIPCTEDYSLGKNLGTGGDLSVNGNVSIDSSNGTVYESGYGQGGLVWIKNREYAYPHTLSDTENGTGLQLNTDSTGVQSSSQRIVGFNANGFSLGVDNAINYSPSNIASWTFRKAPNFFDVVTYTGDGTDARTVSHNLGVVPGMMIVKRTDSTGNWCVYHRSLNVNGDNAPETDYMYLNSTQAASDSDQLWDDTAPTATEFTLHGNAQVNASGGTYVAYLFAHNDGDGGFGPNGDQDIIKCGNYTGNGSDNKITLGFEPQWMLVKSVNTSGDWSLIDNMNGGLIHVDSDPPRFLINFNNGLLGANQPYPVADGFTLNSSAGQFNNSGTEYIYIAIRRGPMAVPESATDVFAMDFLGATSPNPPAYNSSGWPVDMGIQASVGAVNSNANSARLIQGKFLKTDSTDAETTSSQYAFDFQDGWRDSTAVSNNYLGYMWRRAPNFFDVVAYSGNGGSPQTVSHNLGVAPDMLWLKRRDGVANWGVTTSVDYGKFLFLNGTNAESSFSLVGTPTSTEFYPQSGSGLNVSGQNYIAYLFASLDGISKVGSYTGNGGTSVTGTGQNIDCGFSNGARFVLIKPTNAADNWFLYDSERGIVAGNDATLQLNLTAAQSTSSDEIDPLNSGFTILNGNNQLNRTGREYIFYAIA